MLPKKNVQETIIFGIKYTIIMQDFVHKKKYDNYNSALIDAY